jgi:hypothetical protein
VVAVYASSYSKLHGMAHPISQLNQGNVVVYGSTRLIYFSLLVGSATSDAAKTTAQAALAKEVWAGVQLAATPLRDGRSACTTPATCLAASKQPARFLQVATLRRNYDALLYGTDNRTGNAHLASLRGITFDQAAASELFFRRKGCLMEDQAECLQPGGQGQGAGPWLPAAQASCSDRMQC